MESYNNIAQWNKVKGAFKPSSTPAFNKGPEFSFAQGQSPMKIKVMNGGMTGSGATPGKPWVARRMPASS